MTGAVEVLQGVAVVEGVAEVAAEARAVAMAVAEAASVASDEVCQGAFLGSEVAGATAAGQGSAGVADSKGRPVAEAERSRGWTRGCRMLIILVKVGRRRRNKGHIFGNQVIDQGDLRTRQEGMVGSQRQGRALGRACGVCVVSGYCTARERVRCVARRVG